MSKETDLACAPRCDEEMGEVGEMVVVDDDEDEDVCCCCCCSVLLLLLLVDDDDDDESFCGVGAVGAVVGLARAVNNIVV